MRSTRVLGQDMADAAKKRKQRSNELAHEEAEYQSKTITITEKVFAIRRNKPTSTSVV